MQDQAKVKVNPTTRHVLSIRPDQEDDDAVTTMLTTPVWTLHQAGCLRAALSQIRKHPISVVLCERDLAPGTWVDVLETLKLLDHAPPLIVTSRLADDRLWAEALNLGAYDVLAKPFDLEELNRTLNLAFLHWHHSHDEVGAVPKVRVASR
ncbi:MAG: response regulator [Bryobacteraceae bacterium]